MLVAIDLGAESCRVSLLRWRDGQPQIQSGSSLRECTSKLAWTSLRWDLRQIRAGVEAGFAHVRRDCARGDRCDRRGWLGRGLCALESDRANPSPILSAIAMSAPCRRRVWRSSRGFLPNGFTQLPAFRSLALNTLYQLYAEHLSDA